MFLFWLLNSEQGLFFEITDNSLADPDPLSGAFMAPGFISFIFYYKFEENYLFIPCNCNFSKVGTGTVTNSYGSTTLLLSLS
jgi:hypothetical protein